MPDDRDTGQRGQPTTSRRGEQQAGRDSTDSRTVDEKIIALETRVAFQDHLLASLDEVLQEFTRRVQDLELTVRELRTTMSDLDDPGPADQPPPHY